MEKRTALVFGSTGLIGNLLVEELVNSDKYSAIKTFVRQPTGVNEMKVEEKVVNFSDPASWQPETTGDDMFICLGTTIKKAGSVASMEKIDRDLPIEIAAAAAANGVKRIAVVSSVGASAGSSNYYLRIKGEMEEGTLKMNFIQKAIVRPSMLLGDRKERRTAESVSKVVMKAFNPVLMGKLRKYRAIHGRDVARAMIVILQNVPGEIIFESDELKRIAQQF